jgi:hypothetical protein
MVDAEGMVPSPVEADWNEKGEVAVVRKIAVLLHCLPALSGEPKRWRSVSDRKPVLERSLVELVRYPRRDDGCGDLVVSAEDGSRTSFHTLRRPTRTSS